MDSEDPQGTGGRVATEREIRSVSAHDWRFLRAGWLRCPAVVAVGWLVAGTGGLHLVPPRLNNRDR